MSDFNDDLWNSMMEPQPNNGDDSITARIKWCSWMVELLEKGLRTLEKELESRQIAPQHLGTSRMTQVEMRLTQGIIENQRVLLENLRVDE